jgi:DNA mismatch endonuclease, patch repair protein
LHLPRRTSDIQEDDPAVRRRIMQANRRRDTAPELALRSVLHSRGHRFRVDLPIRVPGQRPVRPDIVFTKRRLAIFVDGCYWHGCPIHATWPKRNADFWRNKIETNCQRDLEQTARLTRAGWTVVRVWEHEEAIEAAARIEATLGSMASA